MEKTKRSQTTNALSRQKKEELEWLQYEIDSRNKIIENITKQLTQNQTSLIEHSNATEQLQDELVHSKQLLRNTNKLEQTQQEISRKDNELQMQGLLLQETQAEFDNIRGEIDLRSRSLKPRRTTRS